MKLLSVTVLIIFLAGCVSHEYVDRDNGIPDYKVKLTPQLDEFPPILHSSDYETPVPLTYPVNTAGGEDSPFITPDGRTLYVFFTPDVDVPVEEQLLDGLTGIYVTHLLNNGSWTFPTRLWLNDPGRLSLDGCAFVINNTIWFCSAREGFTGLHWFTATLIGDIATNVQLANFNTSYEVGELHFYDDDLYFHSARPRGKGGYDIYVSQRVNGFWAEPVNLEVVNTNVTEGWPYVSSDGKELWFTRFYNGSPAVYKSERVNGTWQAPELIVSQFAGEPTLDEAGNLYFTHHYYNTTGMLEADIYVAKRINQ